MQMFGKQNLSKKGSSLFQIKIFNPDLEKMFFIYKNIKK